MLTYASLEQGSPALNFQRVDLDALLNQVIEELAPLRPSHGERGFACRRPIGTTPGSRPSRATCTGRCRTW
jgi:hypothetical protein